MKDNSALCLLLAVVALFLAGKVLHPERSFRALFQMPFWGRVRWYTASMGVLGLALWKFKLP